MGSKKWIYIFSFYNYQAFNTLVAGNETEAICNFGF